jgi:hypothetical protein
VGDGSYDFRDRLGLGDCLVPGLFVDTPFGVCISDAAIADLDGDGLADLSVGRLPAVTDAEVRGALAKIAAYEQGGAWKDRVKMVADDPDGGGDFHGASDGLAVRVAPPFVPAKAYLGTLPFDEVRSSTLDAFASGCGVLNYVGHSVLDRLGDEGILRSSDVAAMGNASNAPMVMASTCVFGRYDIPGFGAMGEELVTHPGGGAVAVWAAVCLTYNSENMILAETLFSELFGLETPRIGDAALAALRDYPARGSMPYMARAYNLLGDPATLLRPAAGPPPAQPPAAAVAFEEWLRARFTPQQLRSPALKTWSAPFLGRRVAR